MDILKVLSRGTKKTSKGHSLGAGAVASGYDTQNLPSAGNRTNPQLFHDDARGQKRKRQADDADHDIPEELPEVDFFAPKATHEPETQFRPQNPEGESSHVTTPAARLSDDECRQLLRSHRLKLTFLLRGEDKSKVKKSKKKKKAVAVVEGKKSKQAQLLVQPLTRFGELRATYGISKTIADNLATQGYKEPTEVQLGSLPLLLRPDVAVRGDDKLGQGVDLLAVAPTGSGKTISFLIPAIEGILQRRLDRKADNDHELEAVIIAPTQELVFQIVNEGRKLVQGTSLKITGMKKGMRLETEQEETGPADIDSDGGSSEESDDESADGGRSRGTTKADILVTTPTLLLNYLNSGSNGVQKSLPRVQDLILDEADVLLDPLFRDQTLSIWDACQNPELRQTFWSATLGSNIETLVAEKLQSRAEAFSVTPRTLVRVVVGLKDTAVPNITHKLTYTASEQGKLLALRQLLHPASRMDTGPPLRPPFLVFTQTIDRATALHDELKYDIPLEAGGSSRIAALHGGLTDAARAGIMRKFRAGDIWVLITTDVLARGVDFAGVNGVVNYDVPGSSAAYVHRAGRTGRAGREGGVAVTLYTKEDIPFVKMVANVIAASEKQAGKTGDNASVQKWLLDALPDVGKSDRKKLKERGVEARRSGSKPGRHATITSRSGYERRKEHNRKGAVEASKKRKKLGSSIANDDGGDEAEWAGFGD